MLAKLLCVNQRKITHKKSFLIIHIVKTLSSVKSSSRKSHAVDMETTYHVKFENTARGSSIEFSIFPIPIAFSTSVEAQHPFTRKHQRAAQKKKHPKLTIKISFNSFWCFYVFHFPSPCVLLIRCWRRRARVLKAHDVLTFNLSKYTFEISSEKKKEESGSRKGSSSSVLFTLKMNEMLTESSQSPQQASCNPSRSFSPSIHKKIYLFFIASFSALLTLL